MPACDFFLGMRGKALAMTDRVDAERIHRLVEAFRAAPLEERDAFLAGLSGEDRAAVLEADSEVLRGDEEPGGER